MKTPVSPRPEFRVTEPRHLVRGRKPDHDLTPGSGPLDAVGHLYQRLCHVGIMLRDGPATARARKGCAGRLAHLAHAADYDDGCGTDPLLQYILAQRLIYLILTD